jgi:hypothetical protein
VNKILAGKLVKKCSVWKTEGDAGKELGVPPRQGSLLKAEVTYFVAWSEARSSGLLTTCTAKVG